MMMAPAEVDHRPLLLVEDDADVRDAIAATLRDEGYVVARSLMSYVHLHFASNPALARGFVDACAAARR